MLPSVKLPFGCFTLLRTSHFLWFKCAQYLASSSSSAHEQLEVAPTLDVVPSSALASDCGDASPDQRSSACFDSATQSFRNEWLLWRERAPRASPTAVLNAHELAAAMHRFDHVNPLSLSTADRSESDDGENSMSKKENAAALEATKQAQGEKAEAAGFLEETEDGMPEGGRKRSRARRLTESSTSTADDGDDSEASTPAFTITVGNAYTAKSGGYSAEYPWKYMAEPYRATTLAVEAPVSGASYRWTVDGHVQGYGSSTAVLFQQIGYHAVTVERLAEDKDFEDPVTANVMCKYVRREVRSMTDADREAWLSAVQVLQHVPTSAGQVREENCLQH